MGEPAKVLRPMTLEEFLEWDSGDDCVWELVDGFPRPKFPPNPALLGQAAPSDEHGVIVKNLTFALENLVRAGKLPCRVIPGAGQKVSVRRNRLRIPDLTVKCGPTSREAWDPILVVEVISPSNSARELAEREADFRALPTVREIVVLEQDAAVATVSHRVGDLWRVERLEGLDAVLSLESVGLEVPLREVYRDVLELEAEVAVG